MNEFPGNKKYETLAKEYFSPNECFIQKKDFFIYISDILEPYNKLITLKKSYLNLLRFVAQVRNTCEGDLQQITNFRE